jgi:hypothetical protein
MVLDFWRNKIIYSQLSNHSFLKQSSVQLA